MVNNDFNQETIKNRTFFCDDNINMLMGFNSNSIDLIYLDPPFNKKQQFSAPIGSNAEGASFDDVWRREDIKEAWLVLLEAEYPNLYKFIELSEYIGAKSNKYYLCYMAVRLIEMKRILKDTGSIYLHCDHTMAHYLKLLMDVIFGSSNFRNEIAWCYKENDTASRWFPRKHDSIFFYTKTNNYIFNVQRGDITDAQLKRYNHVIDGDRFANMKGKMRKLEGGARIRDWWEIPIVQSPERTDYPTQKPLALLERIIQASSLEGGLVLDPFCGCATTCVAAERLGRKWVGIDISKKAFELVQMRLKKEIANPEDLFTFQNALIFREDIADRTDIDAKKLSGIYKKEVKERLYGRQHGNCKGCEQHFHIVSFDIDHIVPKVKGGSDDENNLQLLCTYCNRTKGDRTMEWLKSKLAEIRQNK